jgi:hypothetical protein
MSMDDDQTIIAGAFAIGPEPALSVALSPLCLAILKLFYHRGDRESILSG